MLITSKFPGTCLFCQRSIQVGDQVSWIKGRRGAEHAACSAEGKTAKVAVQESRAVDAAIEIPAPDEMAYLPYQRAGIAYAAARAGTLIADEMGLGKTIQVLGLINADATINATLVICPKSLTLNWYREARKWLVRATTIGLVNGAVPPSALVIASYEGAKKHQEALATRSWDLVVVDEAHLIKNQKAQRTKTVHAIAKNAKRRVALTGTPIANRPVELFSILKLVDPGHWDQGPKGGFFAFARRYANAHQTRYGWDFSGASNLPELQDRLRATCMVRRLKADVLTELPPKRRQVVEVGANGAAATVRAEAEAFARQEEALDALRVEAELARVA